MVALVLTCGLLSASPALHRLIHADADASDHSCVITLFTKGQFLAGPEAQVFVVCLVWFGGVVLLAETVFHGSATYLFSASRAPPRFMV